MRIWSYPLDLQRASAAAIRKVRAMLLFEVALELEQFTLPVRMTMGMETKQGSTRFWVDVGEQNE